MKLKKEYTISSETGKNTTFKTPSSNLHLVGRTRYFRHRHTIKLYKNKVDSTVIKYHQCYLEKSHGVLKLFLNSDQGLALFRQKQILTGLLVTKIYKNRIMKILYAITLLL